MFEKYPMIHVDVTNPIANSSEQRYTSSIKLSDPAENKAAWKNFGEHDYKTELQQTQFRLTGSFDFLPFAGTLSEKSLLSGRELFMKGFAVMNTKKDYFIKRDYMEALLLSYTIDGEGILEYEGKEYIMKQGNGFLIDCRRPHTYRSCTEQWNHIDIQIWGKKAPELYRCFEKYGITDFSYSLPQFQILLEKILDMYTDYSEIRELYVDNALTDLLLSILKKMEKEGSTGIPVDYRYMIRYIESNYTTELSLDALSQMFHISKYHLCRKFKEYTGKTPIDYMIELRIRHAAILLAQSNLQVEKVAMESGFGNMSYFISQFKRHTGMTPSALRKSFQS